MVKPSGLISRRSLAGLAGSTPAASALAFYITFQHCFPVEKLAEAM